MTSPPIDLTRTDARALASAGSWSAVASLLAPLASSELRDAELALLYAEARMRCGQERDALAWLRGIVGWLADGPDRAAHRRAVNMLGAAELALGNLDEAVALFGQVLELSTEVDDPLMMAQATNNLGAIANQRGQHQLALWHYRIAVPTLQRVGQVRRLAEGYHNIAITCRDLGELEEADEHERRAIDYAVDADAPRVAAMGRVGRAEIALRRGDARLAETTARLAAEELARLGDAWHEADAHRVSGVAAGAQQKYDVALGCFDRALAIARERRHSLNEADALRDRVEVLARMGEADRAREDAARAVELFCALGATAEVERLERRLASLG